MSKKATNNVLKAIQNDLRTQMNEVRSHGHGRLQKIILVMGIIQGLAFAEGLWT